jgi:hypothetical protein
MFVASAMMVRVSLVAVGGNLIRVTRRVAHLVGNSVIEADDRLHGMRNSSGAQCEAQNEGQ